MFVKIPKFGFSIFVIVACHVFGEVTFRYVMHSCRNAFSMSSALFIYFITF